MCTRMRQRRNEYRVLSLASSWILVLTFAVYLYVVTNVTSSSAIDLLGEHSILLLFVPALLPCFALVRLIRMRVLEKIYIPFFDGWFIHLIILLPYVITLTATYPLWCMV